jgi:high-affinity iron transporter
MPASALVVFREVLEAALIVCVILAATKGVRTSKRFITAGILAGIVGAVLVAVFTGEIAGSFQGNGQEFFGAAVMFTVVGLLGWHIIWMQKHGRELVGDMRKIGAQVVSGEKPLIVLASVVALAVLREGSEIVLFLTGMLQSGDSMVTVASGLGVGLAFGVLAGVVLYWGFVRLPLNTLFSATNILLIMIAAGMAARGAGKLIQTGLIPALQDPVWNTSAFIPEKSLVGQLLGTLVGYMAEPSAMQLLFYGFTVVSIVALMAWTKEKPAAMAV